jgi:hypothetical protein
LALLLLRLAGLILAVGVFMLIASFIPG